jgi:HK97 family phage prohead protease
MRREIKRGERVHKAGVGKVLEAKDSERTIVHVITSRIVDRDGDVIEPMGGRLDNYRKNPVVLFGHEWYGLPVARNLELDVQKDQIIALTQFAGLNQASDEAEQIYRLVRDGFLPATSIGFLPITWSEDKALPSQDGWWFKEWELFEYSVVSIPANPDALMRMIKAYGLPPGATEKDLGKAIHKTRAPYWDVATSLTRRTPSMLKNVPQSISREIADPNTTWSAPSLSDFTDKAWTDLSDSEKSRIAEYFAWADEMPPKTFGELKLPHHRAADGKVVLAGLAAAAGRLGQTQGIDEAAVKAHLAGHYRDAGVTPPWEQNANAATPLTRAREHIAAAVSELGRAAVMERKPELLDVAMKLAHFAKDFEPAEPTAAPPAPEEVPVSDVVAAALEEIRASASR